MAFGSDQELAQQIAGNLKNGGRMKGYSISVKVQGGVVQLDGTVRSEEQRDEALSIAEITPGIERVINNLTVKQVKENKDAGNSLSLRHPASIAAGDKQVVRRAARPTVMSAVRQANAEMPADRSTQAFHYDEPPQMPETMSQSAPAAKGAPRPMQRMAGPAYPQMARASYASPSRRDGCRLCSRHGGWNGTNARVRRRHAGRCISSSLRPAAHAWLCMAKLRRLSKLCGADLP
jgi:hypothetical protein